MSMPDVRPANCRRALRCDVLPHWRAVRALGYRKLVTYTLASENGASLRAAGLRVVGEVRGASWHREARPRVDTAPLQDKLRWEIAA